jgi:hypothetical protein
VFLIERRHYRQSLDLIKSFSPNSPTISGGDFNVSPDQKNPQPWLFDEEMVKFWDSSRLTAVYESQLRERIDFIFFREPYRVTEVEYGDPQPDGSDHAYVFAVLESVRGAPLNPIGAQLDVNVAPYPIPSRQEAVRVTVFTKDTNGNPVAATLHIRNPGSAVREFPSNQPFEWSFVRRINQRTRRFEATTAIVKAPGFDGANVDFGSDNAL